MTLRFGGEVHRLLLDRQDDPVAVILAARAWLDRRDFAHVAQRHPDLGVPALQDTSVRDGPQRPLGHGQGADLLVELRCGGGLDAGAAFVHEDFEMTQLPGWREAASCRGWEEALRAIMDWVSSFDEFRGLPEQFTEARTDLAVVAYHEWGKPRGGSIEIEQLYGMLYPLREGKAARMEWFDSPREARRAAAERSDASAYSAGQ
jgi:hypothetical protein